MKMKGLKFNGLDFTPVVSGEPSNEEQQRLASYLAMHEKVFYIVGHGTKNEYFDLNHAVLQVYKILEAEGMRMKEANLLGPLESWQEKILLVYGGDPRGKHDDVGKLLGLVAQMLKGVKILAVQCDLYKDGALAGGPSYFHVDSFYFYATEYKEIKDEAAGTVKKTVLYGGYTEREGNRIPHGTTAFMADIADKWHGMIVIGGGDIAKKELEFFHGEAQGSSQKSIICVKAEAKNIPRASRRLGARAEASEISDTVKYGSAWCAFVDLLEGDNLAKDGNEVVVTDTEKLSWYKLN